MKDFTAPHSQSRLQNTLPLYAVWAALIAYLLYYLAFLYQIVLPSDLSIMLTFAERIYDGGRAGIDYYDPNPPLNFWVYVPMVALSKITGAGLYTVHFIVTLVLCGISFSLLVLLLRGLSALTYIEKHGIAFIYAASLIIAPSNDFGDREHLVVMGLAPFLLAQIALMTRPPNGQRSYSPPLALLWTCFIIGTVFILIKPPYGLAPTVLLALRLFLTKNPAFWRQPDFIALAAGVLIYAAAIAVFSPGYATIVLPDLLTSYIGNRNAIVLPETALFGMMTVIIALLGLAYAPDKKGKTLILLLCLITLCLLIPYVVQGKGLNNHRIPFWTAFSLTTGITSFIFIRKYLPGHYALIIAGMATAALLIVFRAAPPTSLSQDEFKSLPLSMALEEHCPDPCTFLFFYDYSDTIHQLAFYHNAFHASRFTSPWYYPGLKKQQDQHEKGLLNPAQDAAYAHRLQAIKTMIAEDTNRYKPDVIMVLRHKNQPLFDFYQDIEPFTRNLDQYKKVDTLHFNRSLYYPGFTLNIEDIGTLKIDIYHHSIKN